MTWATWSSGRLTSANAMWAIRESSAEGFRERRVRDLSWVWEGVDHVATRVDRERFEARYGRQERSDAESGGG